MNLNMKAPCANCPFRRQGAISLRPGRLDGIIADLMADDHGNFPCHKTTHKKTEPSVCMGSAVYSWKARRPSVGIRIALAFGMIKREDLEAHTDTIIDPPQRTA